MSLTKVSAGVLNIDDLYGFRNRIINGDMRIDQRNAGAAVTTSGAYAADRWSQFWVGSGALTLQQVSDAPAGFTYSLKSTVATADSSLAASDNYQPFYQTVEGYNTADFAFGTASAKSITLSFWVKASVAGTYCAAFRNSDGSRSFVSAFSVSSADTWEQKTITAAGDTSGTWLTTNGLGMYMIFGSVQGTDKQAPSLDTWLSGNYLSHSSQTNWIATSSATLQVTGVQLEVGSVATPFERRPYGQELSLCQRYYYRIESEDADNAFYGSGFNYSTTAAAGVVNFPVSMRIYPTALEQSGTASDYKVWHGSNVNTNCSSVPVYSSATKTTCRVIFTVASGLTAGGASMLRASVTGAYLAWSAEL